MRCPYCNYFETRVIDSRGFNDDSFIKRRRKCENCQKRFNTTEKIQKIEIKVKKNTGEIEDFDRDKAYHSIIRSLAKRDYDSSKLEEIIDSIERTALNEYEGMIESSKLGELIMDRLFYLDEVAYVRFASVYNKFDNLDSFINTIKELKKKKKKESKK